MGHCIKCHPVSLKKSSAFYENSLSEGACAFHCVYHSGHVIYGAYSLYTQYFFLVAMKSTRAKRQREALVQRVAGKQVAIFLKKNDSSFFIQQEHLQYMWNKRNGKKYGHCLRNASRIDQVLPFLHSFWKRPHSYRYLPLQWNVSSLYSQNAQLQMQCTFQCHTSHIFSTFIVVNFHGHSNLKMRWRLSWQRRGGWRLQELLLPGYHGLLDLCYDDQCGYMFPFGLGEARILCWMVLNFFCLSTSNWFQSMFVFWVKSISRRELDVGHEDALKTVIKLLLTLFVTVERTYALNPLPWHCMHFWL